MLTILNLQLILAKISPAPSVPETFFPLPALYNYDTIKNFRPSACIFHDPLWIKMPDK